MAGPDLVVKVAANISALQKDMTAVQESIKGIETTTAETSAKASDALGGLKKTARDLATDFLAMFTARAAFDFVKNTVNEASALKDLSTQVHIGVVDLQILAGGMSEFGVDADELGKGLYKLSRGIAGGDDSVTRGLHLMGLSLKDVEGLQGKDLFLKIESGLAKLQGGLRDTAAADLFGGKLGAAMAGASDGIEGALETWQRFNHVAGPESVDALDAFGESITRAEKNLSAMATNMMGPIAEGFNTLFGAVDKGASKWAIAWAMAKDLNDTWATGATQTGHLTQLLDDLNQKTDANAAATKKSAGAHAEKNVQLDAQGQAVKFMAALEADAAVALDSAQRANLAHLKEIGALTAQNAAAVGVNASQFAKYTADMTVAEEAVKKRAVAQEAALKLEAAAILATTKLWDEYHALRVSHGGTSNQIAIAQIKQWEADTIAAAIKAGTATKGFYAALAADSKEKMAGVGVDWSVFSTISIPALQETARNSRETYNQMLLSGQFFREDLDAQREKTEEAERAARGMGKAYVDAFKASADAARELAAETKKAAAEAKAADDALRNAMSFKTEATFQNFDDLLKKSQGHWRAGTTRATEGSFIEGEGASGKVMITGKGQVSAYQAATMGYGFGEISQALLGHPLGPNPAGPRIPGFAGGVDNYGGGWAMVGERGPEAMYVPQGASIYPSGSGAGSGSTVIHLHVTQPLGTPAQIAGVVGPALMKVMREHGVRF